MFFNRCAKSKAVALSGEIQEIRHLFNSDSGKVTSELVSQVEIPDPQLFKLEALIKSNVPLKRVDTKILNNGGLFEDVEKIDSIASGDSNSVGDSGKEKKVE